MWLNKSLISLETGRFLKASGLYRFSEASDSSELFVPESLSDEISSDEGFKFWLECCLGAAWFLVFVLKLVSDSSSDANGELF